MRLSAPSLASVAIAVAIALSASLARAGGELDVHSFGPWDATPVASNFTTIDRTSTLSLIPLPPTTGSATYIGRVRGTGDTVTTFANGAVYPTWQNIRGDLTLEADFETGSIDGTIDNFTVVRGLALDIDMVFPVNIEYDPDMRLTLSGDIGRTGFAGSVGSFGADGQSSGVGRFGGSFMPSGDEISGRWGFNGQLGSSTGTWRGGFKGTAN